MGQAKRPLVDSLVHVLLVLLSCSQKHMIPEDDKKLIRRELFDLVLTLFLISAASEEIWEAKYTLADLRSCTPRL